MVDIQIQAPSFAFVYMKKQLKVAMRRIGQEEAKKVRALLRSPGPSKPGEPPALDTGNLAKNVKSRVGKDGTSVAIYDSVYYDKFLESGTTGGGGKQIGEKDSVNPRTGRKTQRRQKNIRGVAQTIRVQAPRPAISVQVAKDINSINKRLIASVEMDISYKATK
jgi:hypothetical protein